MERRRFLKDSAVGAGTFMAGLGFGGLNEKSIENPGAMSSKWLTSTAGSVEQRWAAPAICRAVIVQTHFRQRPQLYAPGAIRADGLVHQGFPYPPVVFWLTLNFVSFGLFAKPNLTATAALLLAAVSVAVAILLILEMDRPYEGLIHISDAPLREAMGRFSPRQPQSTDALSTLVLTPVRALALILTRS